MAPTDAQPDLPEPNIDKKNWPSPKDRIRLPAAWRRTRFWPTESDLDPNSDTPPAETVQTIETENDGVTAWFPGHVDRFKGAAFFEIETSAIVSLDDVR